MVAPLCTQLLRQGLVAHQVSLGCLQAHTNYLSLPSPVLMGTMAAMQLKHETQAWLVMSCGTQQEVLPSGGFASKTICAMACGHHGCMSTRRSFIG